MTSMKRVPYLEVCSVESTRQHASIAKVFDGNALVTLESEIQEIVHLGDDGSCWLGEVAGNVENMISRIDEIDLPYSVKVYSVLPR